MKCIKFSLRCIQWLFYLPIHIVIVLISRQLASFVVKNFSTDNKRYLKWPFRWMETIDNDLSGDDGWRNQHIPKGSDPLSDTNRTNWIKRNGGNYFNYHIIGLKEDTKFIEDTKASKKEYGFFKRNDGGWMIFTYSKLPFINKYLNLFIGWSLLGPRNGYCKFTATIRIKSKVE